jgi:predicted DNA binding CopG/RHH family protein
MIAVEDRMRNTRHSGKSDSLEVTIRLPRHVLDHIQATAAACGIPAEHVIKAWIAEKILDREKLRRHSNARP